MRKHFTYSSAKVVSAAFEKALVQAYTEAFLPSDEVVLVVHSSYGDHFWEQELLEAMGNSSQPAVLFFQVLMLLLLLQRGACCVRCDGHHFMQKFDPMQHQPSCLVRAVHEKQHAAVACL